MIILNLYKRYLVSLKKDIYSLLSISLIFPILLYILVVMSVMMIIGAIGDLDGEPMIKFVVDQIAILTNYEQFSALGIWIVSGCFVSIYISSAIFYRLIVEDKQIEVLQASPVSHYQIVFSLVLFSFTLGCFELLLSISFTYFIGIVNPLSIYQIFFIIFNIIQLIFLSSILGIVIGLFNKSVLSILLSYVALLFFLIFISGTFIPKSLLLDKLQNVINFLPYVMHIESIQSYYLLGQSNFLVIIGTIGFSILLTIVSLVYSNYSLRR